MTKKKDEKKTQQLSIIWDTLYVLRRTGTLRINKKK